MKELDFGIKFLLNERKALGIKINDENSIRYQLTKNINSYYNLEIDVIEFFSFYREVELIENNEKCYIFFDEAFLYLVNNIVSIVFNKNNTVAKKKYKKLLLLYFLENSIKYKSDFTKGFFYEYLKGNTLKLSQQFSYLDNDENLLSRLLHYIDRFTTQHEISHSITQELSLYLPNIIRTLEILKIDEENNKTDLYLSLLENIESDHNLLEELVCDIDAINLGLNICRSIDDYAIFYLSQLILFKIISTLSNIKRFLIYKNFNEFSKNYTEQRVRVDIRCTILIQNVFYSKLEGNVSEFEKFQKLYEIKYKPILQKFEEIRMSAEKEIFSYDYFLKISLNVKSDDINFNEKQILKIMNWIK